MNFKTTLLLVALLLIVGAVWLFYPRSEGLVEDRTAPPTKTEEQKNVFDPQPKDDQVQRVEVDRPGKRKMVFERVESTEPTPRGVENWRVVEPLAVPADGYKVMGLARALTSLQSRSQFEAGAKDQPTAAEAGLEPPTATIALKDKEGKEYKLEIGKKVTMSSDTYVRVAGQKLIQVVSRDLQPQVMKDLKEYRSLRLLQFSLDDAVSIQETYEGKTYDLSRTGAGEWVINEPLRATASSTKVRERLLTPLNTLQAAEFVDEATESPAGYGLDEPFLTLTITTDTKPKLPASESQPATQPEPVKATHKIVVGGFADLKSERRYVKVDEGPGVVIAKQADIANLVPKLGELRDPQVARVKAAAITEIELTSGDSTAVLKKTDGTWHGTGDLAQLDNEAVQDVLDALAGLTAISFIDEPEAPATYGLDHPRAVLTATAAGSLTPIRLNVGNETASGRNAYVQREGEPGVIVVAEAQAERLAISPLALRSREVFTFAPEQVQDLQVQRGKLSYDLVHAGPTWKLTAPADAPVDDASLQLLTLDLSRLRAKRVVGKGDDARYGLDQPMTVLRFSVQAAATSQPTSAPATAATSAPVQHTLRMTLKDKTAYAKKDDDPFIFELDETVYRVLTAELINPQLFTFKPEDVVRVKIVGTGGTLELARENNRWEYVADRFLELAQKKVQDFVRDVAQMRVESWLEYENADLARAGLVDAPASLTIGLSDGREFVVNMTAEQRGQLPNLGGLVRERRTFLLRPGDSEKLFRGVDEYVKSDKPEQPEQPAMPGQPPVRPPGQPQARPPVRPQGGSPRQ